ncbi:CPBP family intramembrane metalloprotease [Clostridiaceae bacterium M8S5]|nr:CPBP family intramembrane metalloprotease [Clostridiaceae bacterium M8S5]
MDRKKTQPYIFKKQIISLMILCIILVFFLFIKKNKVYFNITIFYSFIVLVLTFAPIVRKILKYNDYIQYIVFYVPNFFPIIILNIGITDSQQVLSLVYGFIGGSLLLLLNHKNVIKLLKENSITTMFRISKRVFFERMLFLSLSIVAEEVFFRYFLIGYARETLGVYSILISSILFVHGHYMYRWSNQSFKVVAYIYHFIVGLVLGIVFYLTGAIGGCLLGHFLFNSPHYIVLIRRVFRGEEIKDFSFNDY